MSKNAKFVEQFLNQHCCSTFMCLLSLSLSSDDLISDAPVCDEAQDLVYGVSENETVSVSSNNQFE